MHYFPYMLTHSRGLPSHLAIRCPRCSREADFQFPFSHRGWEEIDRRYAENLCLKPFSPMTVEEMQRRVASGEIRGRLERDGDEYIVVRFPQVFPLDWQPPTETPGTGWGMCICSFCGYFQRHEVRWPDDGYFAFKVRGNVSGSFQENVVWAYTRGHAIALREYIASEGRKTREYPPYEDFLQHIPAIFLRAKNREIIVRRLDRLLHGGRE